jgi:hypothetical protein
MRGVAIAAEGAANPTIAEAAAKPIAVRRPAVYCSLQ